MSDLVEAFTRAFDDNYKARDAEPVPERLSFEKVPSETKEEEIAEGRQGARVRRNVEID